MESKMLMERKPQHAYGRADCPIRMGFSYDNSGLRLSIVLTPRPHLYRRLRTSPATRQAWTFSEVLRDSEYRPQS